MLTDDSITVSSTWELTSVSMRYSQGNGVNTSLFSLVYCTHVWCPSVCYNIWCSLPVCEWVCPVAQSCATKDVDNKDNVCKPNIPAGIKCPPPSKTISPIARFGAISTRLARGSWKVYRKVFGLQAMDPVRQCFLYRMEN